ncbi:MAG: hypothetical protein ACK476_06840, partial [Fluviicola sp.]
MNKLSVYFLLLFISSTCFSQDQAESSKEGVPPSEYTCEIYSKHEDWLPDAFINNATCACLKIPDEERANVIRQILIERLDSVDLTLKTEAISMKQLYVKKEISKHKYNKYIKKKITPIIYEDHVIAYETAGCKANPAPYIG